jgi:hypothetical protein
LQCPLLAQCRHLMQCEIMSAFGGKADIKHDHSKCLLMTQSGHCRVVLDASAFGGNAGAPHNRSANTHLRLGVLRSSSSPSPRTPQAPACGPARDRRWVPGKSRPARSSTFSGPSHLPSCSRTFCGGRCFECEAWVFSWRGVSCRSATVQCAKQPPKQPTRETVLEIVEPPHIAARGCGSFEFLPQLCFIIGTHLLDVRVIGT